MGILRRLREWREDSTGTLIGPNIDAESVDAGSVNTKELRTKSRFADYIIYGDDTAGFTAVGNGDTFPSFEEANVEDAIMRACGELDRQDSVIYFIGEGTVNTPITLNRRVTLEGVARQGVATKDARSVLKAGDGVSHVIHVPANQTDPYGWNETFNLDNGDILNYEDTVIQNINIFGKSGQDTTLLRYDPFDFTARDLNIRYGLGKGMYFSDDARRAEVRNVRVRDVGSAANNNPMVLVEEGGIKFYDIFANIKTRSSDLPTEYVKISGNNNEFYGLDIGAPGNNGSAVYIGRPDLGGDADHNKIFGGNIDGVDNGIGVNIAGSSRWTKVNGTKIEGCGVGIDSRNANKPTIVNPTVIDAQQEGIIASGSNTQLQSVTIQGAGQASSGTYDALVLENESTVDGGYIFGGDARYGIYIDGSWRGALTGINKIGGFNTGKIDRNAFKNTIRNNPAIATYDSDTATVPSGSTSATIDPQLDLMLGEPQVTPNGPLGSASEYYATNNGDGTFTINVDADPGQDVTFNYTVSAFFNMR